MEKNILFIGGAGFIGSNIIKVLCSYKSVKIFVIEPEWSDISRLNTQDVQVIRCDLADTDKLMLILDTNHITEVIHLVSTIIPGSDFEMYKREFKTIIFPSIQLMQACAKKNIRFIYFSSGGTIYGNKQANGDFSFKETDAMAPISYYGWAKQIMENSIHYTHRTEGLRYLILRPSNPYGHGQRIYANQGLIAVSIGKILSGETIQVWGNGNNIRDYIYINDLADIICQLIEKEIENTTINIGSGQGHSINDVLSVLKGIADEDIKVEYLPSRRVDVSNIVLNIDKLKSIMEISMTPFEIGIKKFYDEVKSSISQHQS